MLLNQLNRVINSPFFGLIVFLFSVFYSFFFIFYGLDHTDSFFYLNSFINNTQNPMWAGTSLIGNLIFKLTEGELIIFRIINYIIYIAAIIIPPLCILPFEKIKEYFILFSLPIFVLNILNTNIFGIDSLTLLNFSLLATVILKYFKTNKTIYLFFIAVLITTAIHIRFPNLIICSVCLIVVFFRINFACYSVSTAKLIKSLIFVIFSLLLYLISSSFLGQSRHLVLEIFYFIKASSANSYKFENLIGGYLIDLLKIIKYIGIFTFLAFMLARFNGKKIYVFVLISIFIVLILKYDILIDNTRKNVSYVSSSGILFIFGYLLFYKSNKIYNNRFHYIIIPVIIAFGSAIGSNTGLSKIAPILVIFTPIALIIYNQKIHNEITIFLLVAYFAMTLIKPIALFEDVTLNNITTSSKINKIKYISTSKARITFLNDVIVKYDSIMNGDCQNIIFWGKNSHIFNYLTGCKSISNSTFWMNPNDSIEMLNLEHYLQIEKPVIFFVPNYPEVYVDYELSLFNKLIINSNYRSSNYNSYRIFTPN